MGFVKLLNQYHWLGGIFINIIAAPLTPHFTPHDHLMTRI